MTPASPSGGPASSRSAGQAVCGSSQPGSTRITRRAVSPCASARWAKNCARRCETMRGSWHGHPSTRQRDRPPLSIPPLALSRGCPCLASAPCMAPPLRVSFDVRPSACTKMTSAGAISLQRYSTLCVIGAMQRRIEPGRPDRHQMIERAAGGSRSHPRQTARSSNGLATATSTRSRRSCVSGWMACIA